MGRNLRWSIVAASRPQRRMAVQDNGAKVRLFPATNQSVPRRLRPSLCESHLFARQGGERAAERLMSLVVVASPGDRSPDPCNLAESTSVQACRWQASR